MNIRILQETKTEHTVFAGWGPGSLVVIDSSGSTLVAAIKIIVIVVVLVVIV